MPKVMDAVDQGLFNQVLEAVYNMPRGPMKTLEFFPPITGLAAGAMTYTYWVFSEFGMAKIIASSGTDIPRVGMNAERRDAQVYDVGDMYGYSLTQIEAAKMAKVPLSTQLASTARYSIEHKIDELAERGDAQYNILGAIDHPNIGVTTLASGHDSGTTLFAGKTIDEVVEDVRNVLVNGIKIPNREQVEADTVLFPTEVLSQLETRRIDKTSQVSFLDHLKKTFPGVTRWDSLPGLSTAGALGTTRMMALKRGVQFMGQAVQEFFRQLDPQPSGFDINVYCKGRTAGFICFRPLAAQYADGV